MRTIASYSTAARFSEGLDFGYRRSDTTVRNPTSFTELPGVADIYRMAQAVRSAVVLQAPPRKILKVPVEAPVGLLLGSFV